MQEFASCFQKNDIIIILSAKQTVYPIIIDYLHLACRK